MNTKPKVALFSTSFLSYSQTFIYDEIKAHKRYEIDVFCKERKNEKRFPYDSYFKPHGKLAEFIYENIAYWPAFNKRIKNTNYNLIHAHFGTGAVYALPYKLRYDIPLIVTFHGHDVAALIQNQLLNPRGWRYALYANKILNEADLILTVSNELADILRQKSGRTDDIRVFNLGLDLEKFAPHRLKNQDDISQITMVGRFTQKKGHMTALQAFKKVIDANRRAHLNLVGSGELKPQCEEYVQNHKLDKYITFHDVMNSSEISALLNRSIFIIVPSMVADDQDREGCPTVIKEANACGIPAIGTYHSGIHEIIDDGVTGYLVPERQNDALANRMIDLIDHPKKCNEFGKTARKKMEREYDIVKQVEKLELLYDEVAQIS